MSDSNWDCFAFPTIAELKSKYGIRTSSNKGRGTTKWLAIAPFDANDARSLEAIYADECRTLDEAGRMQLGSTEREAVIKLIAILTAKPKETK